MRASQIQSKIAQSPVYTGLYHYKGTHSLIDLIQPSEMELGVGHGDDLLLLFASLPDAKLSESDIKMKNILLDLLGSFARTG